MPPSRTAPGGAARTPQGTRVEETPPHQQRRQDVPTPVAISLDLRWEEMEGGGRQSAGYTRARKGRGAGEHTCVCERVKSCVGGSDRHVMDSYSMPGTGRIRERETDLLAGWGRARDHLRTVACSLQEKASQAGPGLLRQRSKLEFGRLIWLQGRRRVREAGAWTRTLQASVTFLRAL